MLRQQLAIYLVCFFLLCSCVGLDEYDSVDSTYILDAAPDFDPYLIDSEKRIFFLQEINFSGIVFLESALGTLKIIDATIETMDSAVQVDQASGISLVTTSNCSHSGDVYHELHFEDDRGGTPQTFETFSEFQVETNLRIDWKDCLEHGRKGTYRLQSDEDPNQRLDLNKQLFIDGRADIVLTSFPLKETMGFKWNLNADLQDFHFSRKHDNTFLRNERFDGTLNISLKTKKFLENGDILADIYFNFQLKGFNQLKERESASYDYNAVGQVTIGNAYKYDLEISATRLIQRNGENLLYKFDSTRNLKSDYEPSMFFGISSPTWGEMNVRLPDGRVGQAVFRDGEAQVQLDGQYRICSFDEFISADRKCFIDP